MKQFQTSFVLLFLLFTINSYAQQKIDASLEKQIESLFSDWNTLDEPGATIAVVHKGKMVYSKGFGAANLEHQVPISTDTKFQVSSLSNQFFAFAMLLLQEEGKLSLDDDIRKYLPELPDFGRPITIRHCLTHTHGLPDYYTLLSIAGWGADDLRTPQQILGLVSQLKESKTPAGDVSDYSTTGFVMASLIAERITNQPFHEFAQERIFEPLNMKNTLFYGNPKRIIKNKANAYNGPEGDYQNESDNYYSSAPLNLYTTSEDLALWSINLKNPKVGSASSIKELNARMVLNNGETVGAALGQYHGDHKGLHKYYQNGMAYGNLAYIARFAEQDYAIAVLSNYYRFNAENLALEITDLVLADELIEPDDSAPVPAVSEDESGSFTTLATSTLESYCGDYWNNEGLYSRKIYFKNDTIRYFRGEGNESLLVPLDEQTFQMLNFPQVTVKFETIEAKKMMTVSVGDFNYVHERYESTSVSEEELKEFVGTFFSKELNIAYNFDLQDAQLRAKNSKSPTVNFSPLKKDQFIGDQSYFPSITFVRNSQKQIIGFNLASGVSKSLWFEKINLSK